MYVPGMYLMAATIGVQPSYINSVNYLLFKACIRECVKLKRQCDDVDNEEGSDPLSVDSDHE